ncbi:unnamed protein product [Blepharisma stoltei]|uniref:C2H2-type domain-containing protein n=1 Tax=Blepharisma stoltei TaxID=1481888 RepID=A0AAU9J2U4_9CILI|nr:unnamed protein product [Blepharisma stoltei]
MSERIFCPYEDCGRGFFNKEDLRKHLTRRHLERDFQEAEPPTEIISEAKEENDIQEADDTINEIEKMKEKLFNTQPQTKNDIKTPDYIKEEITAEIGLRDGKLEKNEFLTVDYLLETTGQDTIDDITELILRDKNLQSFESSEFLDLSEMISLEYLCLSHNKLKSIVGVSELLGLQEINVNNNMITDLSPLESLSQLRKLFCSNNQIKVILPLKGLKQLSTLSIYNNKLFDLDSSLKILQELPKLKELDIDRNPCILQTQNSRYRVIIKLKLELLDGEAITDVDIQIAHDLYGELETFIPKNFVGRLRTSAKVQEANEMQLLYAEVEELRNELEEVKEERDKLLQEKVELKKEDPEFLKEENERLRREVASMYVLLDEVNDLRYKLKEGMGAVARQVFEENVRLRARVVELENKKKKNNNEMRRPYTAATSRPMTSAGIMSRNEAISDEVLEAMVERNAKMLKDLEVKVNTFKTDLSKKK